MNRLIAWAVEHRRLVVGLAVLCSAGGLWAVGSAAAVDGTLILVQGALLVALVVLLFMGRLRSALLVALQLLVAVLATFLVLRGLGIPLKLGTLAGLLFAVGLLGDGAIVLVENAVRLFADLRRRQRPPAAVVLEAASQVGRPVVFGQAVILVVFLALVPFPGPEGGMFTPLPVTVLVALGSALVLTLTVVPAVASWTSRPGPIFPRSRIPHPGDLVRRIYRPHLAWALRHPGWVVGGTVAFLGTTALVIPALSVAPGATSRMLGPLVWRAPVALVLMFGLLYFHYRDLRRVALSLIPVPLAVAGGLLGLQVSGLGLSPSASLGLYGLLGLSVPSGLVMMELFHDLELEGKNRDVATRMGAELGLRPVLMIAATTAAGLAPLLWASGPGLEPLRPLAVVAIPGVLISTLLTVMVLPVLYRSLEGSTGRRASDADEKREDRELESIPA